MAKRYTKRQVCGLSKWKTFAEDKINVAEKMKLSLERVKKTLWGKEENAGYQHFHLFPAML